MWVNARRGKIIPQKRVSNNKSSWPGVQVELEGIQLIHKKETNCNR
jgi:hypothetical protein